MAWIVAGLFVVIGLVPILVVIGGAQLRGTDQE